MKWIILFSCLLTAARSENAPSPSLSAIESLTPHFSRQAPWLAPALKSALALEHGSEVSRAPYGEAQGYVADTKDDAVNVTLQQAMTSTTATETTSTSLCPPSPFPPTISDPPPVLPPSITARPLTGPVDPAGLSTASAPVPTYKSTSPNTASTLRTASTRPRALTPTSESTPPTTITDAASISQAIFDFETASTSEYAEASAALKSCVRTNGGINPVSGIDKGCKSIFDHILTCFDETGPAQSPYDDARNHAYRTCVCMTSDDNPFSEYSALWKNFSGCAACIFEGVTFDIDPWGTVAVRRLQNFCRAQEPNAFLFTLVLKSWFLQLGDYLDLTATPFAGLNEPDGMPALKAQYTGRPPLANVAWGPSALPDWMFAKVSPSLTTSVIDARVQGETLTKAASSLVTWVPTAAGETFNRSEAGAKESELANRMLHRGICMAKGPCRNEASRRAVVCSTSWICQSSVGVALAIGAAAVYL